MDFLAPDIVYHTTLMLDSTTVKIHQHEAALKRGPRRAGTQPERIDHEIVDGRGNPFRLLLSPGNRNDICYA